MEQAKPILVLEHLTKRYGTIEAVVDANLTVYPGEIVALLGDNGAGKSTLVKMISGATVPTAGHILLAGQEQHFHSPRDAREAGIETVYQDLALAPHLNIPQNMFLGRVPLTSNVRGRMFGHMDTKAMSVRAAEALEQLHITVKSLKQPIARLSGGQRQAVAIARSIMWGEKLLLLDEPTNHLGVQEVEMVLNLVKRISEHGVAVIYISHTIPHVFEIAHRIAVMRLGRITAILDTKSTSMDEIVSYITGTKVSA
ncbi:MAG: ATP-binding cassette domain-containing protein [Ktedonobacteraceae bacterium]